MEIKYEMDGTTCKTPCPHQKTDLGFLVRVRSRACFDCKCFCGNNDDNKTVTCNYGEVER